MDGPPCLGAADRVPRGAESSKSGRAADLAGCTGDAGRNRPAPSLMPAAAETARPSGEIIKLTGDGRGHPRQEDRSDATTSERGGAGERGGLLWRHVAVRAPAADPRGRPVRLD